MQIKEKANKKLYCQQTLGDGVPRLHISDWTTSGNQKRYQTFSLAYRFCVPMEISVYIRDYTLNCCGG